MSKLKLSFVIPAHNEEKLIGKCLDSILREIKDDPNNVEIVVVNNCSTDRTGEIAASYSGVRVVDEPQKGLVRARKAGFEATSGDLIANVDSDNILTKDWIKKVLTEFSNNEKLVALSGPVVFYDLSWFDNLQAKFVYVLGYISYLFSHFVFKKGGMLQGGNFVVRRSALEKIGGFDTSIDFYGEDTDIARRLQDVGYVKFTFGLPILSTGRRLAKEGIVVAGVRYIVNYLWILIFKKPFHTKSTDVRQSV